MKRWMFPLMAAMIVSGCAALWRSDRAKAQDALGIGSQVTVNLSTSGEIVADFGDRWLVKFTDPRWPMHGIAVEMPKQDFASQQV